MDRRLKELDIYRYKPGDFSYRPDILVEEYVLTILINQTELVTLICTPENLEELAVGFLVSEGFIEDAADLKKVELDTDRGLVDVHIDSVNPIAEKTFLRRYITTGCGKGTSFYHAMDALGQKKAAPGPGITVPDLQQLLKKFQQASTLYQITGGVHSAALCDTKEILFFQEDIGRHNAVDKIIGRCFMERISWEGKIFLTSGRISSEILLKAAKTGVGMLVSRAAPTALAVKIARDLDLTVIGFARGNRFNLYAGNERVIIEDR